MSPTKTNIFLLFNPNGVVDKDIYLSSEASGFTMECGPIDISRSPEGHTLERLDIMATARRIVMFQPEFVLTVNGCGLDNNGLFSSFCAAMEIPLVVWYVDEPFFISEWGNKFIPEATIGCTFDRFYEKRLKEWGMYHVFTLPLGTNPERLLDTSHYAQKEQPYKHTISFVGSLEYEKIQYLLKNIFDHWTTMPPEMVDVLERAIEIYRRKNPVHAEAVLHECAETVGVKYSFPNGIVKQMVLSFMDREASFRQRQEIIQGLKVSDISVFGEAFWGKIIGTSYYKGRINYYSSEIRDLYKNSRINLNISKYQLKTTVNQRVFDCPLCDGFLITDFKEDIEDYFKIDSSMVVYFDQQDLEKKIQYYLSHEKHAQKVIEKGKETILERHTYRHRLEEMTNLVKQISQNPSFRIHCREGLKKACPKQLPEFLNAVFKDIDGLGIRAHKQFKEAIYE
jgi:spore maturation protein CgeB